MEEGNTIGLALCCCYFGVPVLGWVSIFVLYPASKAIVNQVFFGWPSPMLKPTQADVVGAWHLSQGSVEYLQSIGHPVSTHQLVFDEDRTFHMHKVPNAWGHLDRSPEGEDLTGSGSWRIQHTQSWEIISRFQTINGQMSEADVRLQFKGRTRPYALGVPPGDGGVVFVRE